MVCVYCKFTGTSLGYSEQHEEALGLLDCLIKRIEGSDFVPKTDATPEGKPFFTNSDVKFSLSHSDGCVVCALSSDKEIRWPAGINGSKRIALIPARPSEIGCDVEPYENRLGENAKRKVAKRYFSYKENDLIGTNDDFNRAFTRMWTAKESYVKCTGEGLGGLSKTDVTSPGENYEIFSYDIKKGRKAYSVSVCIRK